MTVTAPELNVVGTSPIRHDGVDKVTGHAVFGVDVQIPGMLHAQVLRSPHAHARITRIDTSRAEALPGVLATMTSVDMPLTPADGPQAFGNAIRLKAMNVLARDKALYHGHAVAAVAATSPHIAAEALRLIDVEYDVLDPVLDAQSAIAPSAPILHPDLRMETAGEFAETPGNIAKHIVLEEGDVEAGFAAADVILERNFSTSTIHQGYIEPHNATTDSPPTRLVQPIKADTGMAFPNDSRCARPTASASRSMSVRNTRVRTTSSNVAPASCRAFSIIPIACFACA